MPQRQQCLSLRKRWGVLLYVRAMGRIFSLQVTGMLVHAWFSFVWCRTRAKRRRKRVRIERRLVPESVALGREYQVFKQEKEKEKKEKEKEKESEKEEDKKKAKAKDKDRDKEKDRDKDKEKEKDRGRAKDKEKKEKEKEKEKEKTHAKDKDRDRHAKEKEKEKDRLFAFVWPWRSPCPHHVLFRLALHPFARSVPGPEIDAGAVHLSPATCLTSPQAELPSWLLTHAESRLRFNNSQ